MKFMSIYNAFGFSISGIGANLDFEPIRLSDVCHSGKIKEQRKTDDTSFL